MGDGAHEDAAALVRQASAEDGEMVRLVREFDWAAVGMGDPADWPAELRVACRICLNSQYPMVVWWGPQMRCIYNDAYRPLLGGKHPAALGSPGEQVWAEAWPLIEPSMRQVLESGVSIGAQDVRADGGLEADLGADAERVAGGKGDDRFHEAAPPGRRVRCRRAPGCGRPSAHPLCTCT